ncbi:MAG: fibronectin type III domain-containing protein [Acutalibacteraceae bacterium]
MKRKMKSVLSFIFSVVMLLSVFPASFFVEASAAAVTISDFKNGDVISFGSYPQSRVTDSKTVEALNKISAKWVSYGYYSGAEDYGTSKAGSFMKYTDVTYGSKKYRGVKFTKYRPGWVFDPCDEIDGTQIDNGYKINTVYWFRYDSLKWKILDAKSGLVLCLNIIDSQPFTNTIHQGDEAFFGDKALKNSANDYMNSSLRSWLNSTFYQTAFSSQEQAKIAAVKLDANAKETDKAFLLSKSEALNKNYGFSSSASSADSAKRAKGTAYAKCQGLYVSTDKTYSGYSNWLLRSAASSSHLVSQVTNQGTQDNKANVARTNIGIRPAIKLNLKSDFSSCIITPAQVTGLSASNKTASTAELKWNKVSYAQKYYVLWYNTKTKEYKKLGETTKTTCTLSSLKENTEYIITVKAVKTVGAKDYAGKASAKLTFKTPVAVPAQVTGLAVTEKSATSASLKWNSVANADKYIVLWYSEKDKKYKELGRAAKESCTINSLKAGTKNTFKIQAVRTVDGKDYEGKASSALSFNTVTEASAKKYKVGEVTTSARTTTTSTLTWKKISGADGYTVYQYNGSKWEKAASVTTNKWTAKNLKAATTYKFKVAAYKKSGGVYVYGSFSDVLTTSTKPAVPKISAKAVGDSKVTVTCSKVTGAQGYFLYYSTSANGKYTRYTITTKTSHTVKLEKGKTYYFKAKAYRTVNSVNYVSEFTAPVKVKVK